MLGKRKEKLIRDMILIGSGLAADMFDLLEKWLDAKAHLDEKVHREGVDRIVEAIEKIARPRRETLEVEPEPAILKKPIDPQFDRTFCGTGRIVIESDNNQFRIAAYLPGQAYTFMHGTEAQCYACWGNAVAWMQGKVDARK